MNKGIVSDGILSCIKEGIEERERNAIFALLEMEIAVQLFFFPFVLEKMIYVWKLFRWFKILAIDYLIEKL